jgi:uncharacterized protein (UPF0332 family)
MNRPSACTEAVARAAVSRAYYAAHHAAHQLLNSRTMQLPNPSGTAGIHQQVLDAINGVNDSDWKLAGQQLEELRRLRVHADYHMPLPATNWGGSETAIKKKATFAVMTAPSLINSLPRLP